LFPLYGTGFETKERNPSERFSRACKEKFNLALAGRFAWPAPPPVRIALKFIGLFIGFISFFCN
jgi:hypothetical protein